VLAAVGIKKQNNSIERYHMRLLFCLLEDGTNDEFFVRTVILCHICTKQKLGSQRNRHC
jgi:hypothetical protein